MKNENKLVEGPLFSTLLWFTIPFLLSSLLQTLYGTVDTWTIGNYGSTAGVSAVATGSMILALVTFFAIGLSSGGTILLGQRIGAKDHQGASKLVGNIIINFAIISVLLMGIMLVSYRFLLNVMNIPPEAVSEANNYMRICSFGIPLIIGYNIVGALLRAIGDSKSPLLFVGVACLINVIGDFVLTGVLHMGAAGVALATVTAQGASFLFSLLFLMRKGFPFPFSKNDIVFDRKVTGRIFRIGLPMGIQSLMVNMSFMFITAIINAMGVSASAAMGIGDKIVGFAFMPQHAFSASIAVVVAQNIGAGQSKRAFQSVKIGMGICFLIEIIFFVICQLAPEFFPAFFSKDRVVLQMTGQYLQAYSYDAVLTALVFCMSGFLNGCGKTTFNLIQNLVTTFLVRIPATYVLANLQNTNLFWIGLAAPLSTLISILMLGYFILSGRWKSAPEESNV